LQTSASDSIAKFYHSYLIPFIRLTSIVLILSILLASPSSSAAIDLNYTIAGTSEVGANSELESLASGKNYHETIIGADFIIQCDTGPPHPYTQT